MALSIDCRWVAYALLAFKLRHDFVATLHEQHSFVRRGPVVGILGEAEGGPSRPRLYYTCISPNVEDGCGPIGAPPVRNGKSDLAFLEQWHRAELRGGVTPSRSVVGIRSLALSGWLVPNWNSGLAELATTLPLDQTAQAFGEDERSGAHLDDLNLSSGNEQIERAAADASESTGIRNSHADRLDRQRR